ncbi:MAG: CpsD/CapB family tyrosine-protein kinase [Acidobacteriota bacterium]
MGRVYNALIKSDRWRDRSRPIGAPSARHQSRDEQTAHTDEQWTAPQDNQYTWNPKDFDQAAEFESDDSESEKKEFHEASHRSTDHSHPEAENEFALSQTKPGLPRLRVASVPAPPAFTEPNRSLSVLDLAVEPHLAAVAASDALAAERFRTLAVRILNLASRRKLKTMLVTSAQEGEGKSTVAANLAWVMAKKEERRVLLVDSDLRRPSIDRLLGIETERGWLDMIESKARLHEAAVRIDPNGLYVLTPRATREAALQSDYHTGGSDAFTSSRVEEMLRDLENFFDFIVIDSPPILEFADSQRLASIVDGTMIVVRAGRTHHDAVMDALKLIPKERRLGVALNCSQVEEEAGYYRKKKTGLFGRKK